MYDQVNFVVSPVILLLALRLNSVNYISMQIFSGDKGLSKKVKLSIYKDMLERESP
jgi:hypothetical protein